MHNPTHQQGDRKTGHRNELISTPHCDQQLIGGATTYQQLSLVGITQNSLVEQIGANST